MVCRVLGRNGLDVRALRWKIHWQYRYSPPGDPPALHSYPDWIQWMEASGSFRSPTGTLIFSTYAGMRPSKRPVSQHQLFAVCFDCFPCGEGWAKEGNDLEKANGNTRRLPRLHPFSPATIWKWCNGTVIGFHWQENHRYTHTHTHTLRVQGCGRDAPR